MSRQLAVHPAPAMQHTAIVLYFRGLGETKQSEQQIFTVGIDRSTNNALVSLVRNNRASDLIQSG